VDTILSQQLRKQKADNPHKRMHKVVFVVVVACLTAQVIEGAFIIPYILIHFGFPTLSLKEICDEMYIIAYKNEDRECNFPYPLFAGPEPWKYKDMTDVIGRPAPHRPHYEGFGFREVIQRREARMARKAAEAAVMEMNEEENGEEKKLQDPLTTRIQKPYSEGITGYEVAVSTRVSVDYLENSNDN
jgi:hypothetical protein